MPVNTAEPAKNQQNQLISGSQHQEHPGSQGRMPTAASVMMRIPLRTAENGRGKSSSPTPANKAKGEIPVSIILFLEREGDQSRTLYPLFDREARLQVAISREMYATKLRIDEVLTKEQRQTLLKHKKERPQRKPVK